MTDWTPKEGDWITPKNGAVPPAFLWHQFPDGGWAASRTGNECLYVDPVKYWDKLDRPPADPALIAKLKATLSPVELRAALQDLLVAVKFKTPPKNFGGTETEPNLCYEARVPIRFVEAAEKALANAR